MSMLAPPIAFGVVLVAALCLSAALSRLALKPKTHPGGATKPYACGEDLPSSPMIQPDYGQFLPFAFFFTILHVVALTVTTVPVGTGAAVVFALVYVAGAVLGLRVLFRG
jgi:NADH-quinone oxidoreductase subunit A